MSCWLLFLLDCFLRAEGPEDFLSVADLQQCVLFVFWWCEDFHFECCDVGFDLCKDSVEFGFAGLHAFVGSEGHVEGLDQDLDFVLVEHFVFSEVRPG